jgi:arylformamidase
MHGRIIDITVGVSRDTSVYPGDPETVIESVSSIESDGYAVSRVTFGTHTGTHVDAPSHILENGLTVDRLPLSSFLGKAVVLDLSGVTVDISHTEMQVAFKRSGAYSDPHVDTLLVKTRKYSADLCKQTSELNDSTCGLKPEVGPWVLEHGFKLIGIDALSVDCSAFLGNHRMFLEKGVVILENIDLSLVKEGIYHIICLPLKLEGCDAAPARVILLTDDYFP